MNKGKIVWSSEEGDLRKKESYKVEAEVSEKQLELHLRRLTSGKGRVIIEVTNLPNNKRWCKNLAKEIKKSLGVGGAYKNDYIEVHGEKLSEIKKFLDTKSLKWKQTGG